MIVTCDHCGAKYNLDPTKVQGRGARITCPKCTHVFTVYKEGVSSEPTEDVEVTSAPLVEGEEDVYGLDFKSVGIRSWKVKVKIGLVYDFSDYKTLEKYIRDGRVSGTDMLSYNGQDWVSINEVGDLKAYFISVYKKCEADPLNSEPEEKKSTPKPTLATNPNEESELSEAFAAAHAEVTGEMPKAIAPSLAGNNRKPAKKPKKSSKSARKKDENLPKERNPLITIVVGVLAIGGLWFVYSNFVQPPVVVKKPSPVQPEADRSTEIRDEIRQQLEEKAQEERKAALAVAEAEPSEEAEEEWIPVVPAHVLAQQQGGAPVTTAPSTNQSPRDHANSGRQKASVGDWNGAVAAYQKAVDGDSTTLSYQEGLGEALFRAGKTGEAKAILQVTLASGSTVANKWLGYISREEGDLAGSNQYFQRYLETNPSDAGEIEQVMRGG